MILEVISRDEAKFKGLVYFFTNVPCKNGHIDKRYTNTGVCYSCKRQNINKDYSRHKVRIQTCNKKSASLNTESRKLLNKKWAENNREKSNAIKKKYKINHREKYLRYCREYQCNKRKDPLYRLNRAVSKAIWSWLKTSKGYLHWECLVNFTIEDLRLRMESLFQSDMNWNNYGSLWSLDHIKPLSLCVSFQEAWDLSNLQPLYCGLNSSKRNRWIG